MMELAESKENINNQDFLTFVIDDKTYAFPVLNLQSVVGNPDISKVTDAPEFVAGVYHVNGFYTPILDLRVILNKPNLIYPTRTCVIIIRTSFKGTEKLVGFLVDSLFSIYHILVNSIKKLPFDEDEKFIDGIISEKDKIILLLNLKEIINEENVISFLNQFWTAKIQVIQTDNRRNKNGA